MLQGKKRRTQCCSSAANKEFRLEQVSEAADGFGYPGLVGCVSAGAAGQTGLMCAGGNRAADLRWEQL